MNRHTGPLSHDVPQSAIDGAHRIARIDAGPPVRRQPSHLPDILDFIDVASDGRGLEILLDGLSDDRLTLGMTAASYAVQSRLAREHLGVGHVRVADLSEDDLDVGDLESRQTPARCHLCGLEWIRQHLERRRARTAARQQPEGLTPVHRLWSVHERPPSQKLYAMLKSRIRDGMDRGRPQVIRTRLNSPGGHGVGIHDVEEIDLSLESAASQPDRTASRLAGP